MRDLRAGQSWKELHLVSVGLHDRPAMARSRPECCCEVGRIKETRLRAPSCSQAKGEMERWERERPMLANRTTEDRVVVLDEH